MLDLEALRASPVYKNYFAEHRVKQLVKNYMYHSSADIPTLGDMMNLMAADSEALFYPLGCEWNRNSKSSMDVLEKEFNVCSEGHHVHAWNGNPNLDRLTQTKDKGISIGRKRVDNDVTNEFR